MGKEIGIYEGTHTSAHRYTFKHTHAQGYKCTYEQGYLEILGDADTLAYMQVCTHRKGLGHTITHRHCQINVHIHTDMLDYMHTHAQRWDTPCITDTLVYMQICMHTHAQRDCSIQGDTITPTYMHKVISRYNGNTDTYTHSCMWTYCYALVLC